MVIPQDAKILRNYYLYCSRAFPSSLLINFSLLLLPYDFCIFDPFLSGQSLYEASGWWLITRHVQAGTYERHAYVPDVGLGMMSDPNC